MLSLFRFKLILVLRFILGYYSDIKNLKKNFSSLSNVGLCLYIREHELNAWQVAGQYYLYQEFISKHQPIIISSKLGMLIFGRRVNSFYSAEPGYMAPRLRFPKNKVSAIFVSDPWSKPNWLPSYYKEKNVTYILTPYRNMFLNTAGLTGIPSNNVISFPWCVPEQFINNENLVVNSEIIMFGANKNVGFYNMRTFLSSSNYIDSVLNFGGSENRAFTLGDYFNWLSKTSCCVCAVSDEPYYSFPVAKNFEIPASGSLLLTYECDELNELGFIDGVNCIVFNKYNFDSIARKVKMNPENYVSIRKSGTKLIKSRHLISHRIDQLESILGIK